MEKATFAAGRFWGLEAEFCRTPGVKSTRVGYTGGASQNPTHGEVSAGATGHAETVEVTYDSSEVAYEELLMVFWQSHDPTAESLRPGTGGSHRRSIIFFHTPEQKLAAAASKRTLAESGRFHNPIVTEILPAATFWEAESHHQQHMRKRGVSPCQG